MTDPSGAEISYYLAGFVKSGIYEIFSIQATPAEYPGIFASSGTGRGKDFVALKMQKKKQFFYNDPNFFSSSFLLVNVRKSGSFRKKLLNVGGCEKLSFDELDVLVGLFRQIFLTLQAGHVGHCFENMD